MRLAVLILATFVAFSATAADLTWSWTNPVRNVDGSSIPATGPGSLASGRLEFGTCNGTAFGTKAGEMPLSLAQVNAHTVTQTNLLPSTICGRVYVSNTFGAESAASNVALVTVPIPVPGVPSGLSGVTVNVTVNINQ